MQPAGDIVRSGVPDGVNSRIGVQPFKTQLLKWVGNKQRFAHEIVAHFPSRFGTYHEPFLGSGGVLGVLAPARAEAADSFGPLVAIWQALKHDPERLKDWYRTRWEDAQGGDAVAGYEAIRARYNSTGEAADFLYLTRAAYGGVIRFRRSDGHISTPCGSHRPIHPDKFAARVDDWARRVAGTAFFHREYAESLDRARDGDVVYCDPPYSHSQAILYGAQGFDLGDLLARIGAAKARGVFVALSLDGSKKSGSRLCPHDIPPGLFAREAAMHIGRSMLKRFQMVGQSLEGEVVTDRLLLTH